MNTRYQTQLWMSAIALVMAIGQGCTSHSVGYTVDSEGQGMGENGVAMGTDPSMSGEYPSGRSFAESGESYDPGAVGSTRGYGWGVTPDGTDLSNGAYNYKGLQYVDPETGMPYGGSDYGHNYSGADGYRSNNGPVTGFGSGSAESVNPSPEEWAEAFLRGNGSGTNSSGGGLVSEHVDQDFLVAKQNSSGSNGLMYQTDGGIQSSRNGGQMVGANGEVQDVYFAFDSWKISKDGVYSLENDADWLKAHPGQPVTIEGHCDERGTQDYNMVLGKKRAEATRTYLIDLGVDASQLKVVSYGKERPFCSEQNEFCYQQNRRGHMTVHTH